MHTLAQLKSGELSGIKRLSLSENLTSFPLDILTLADSLEILDLSNNQLADLPKEITQLTKLKILFASNNLFTHLPEVIGKCQHLEMVGFKSNSIVEVAENALPPKLRWLILTDNQIEQLPESLGERPRLQKLALAGNNLTSLPNSLSRCHQLELIRISANQLTEFPKQLFDLPKLAWLAFAGNPFSTCHEFQASVPQLASSSYHLQEVLGQGASGVISKAVWKNKQNALANDIAVKVFKGEVTSDGYPKDELQACLKTGDHPNLVRSLAQVNEENVLALIMNLIPANYQNLGLPPCLNSCTRDRFLDDFTLSINSIEQIVTQMRDVFEHLHQNQVSHGDLYAHNTLFAVENDTVNIIVGDFGAASMYHMLPSAYQENIKQIEQRALNYFIADLLSVCQEQDKSSEVYQGLLRERI